ncbi:carbonic anhydrase [Nitrosomonas aestuarii]|uniref:carbonic anhydrase n=1 Tax=Nitrosomonas aestuarii TaxID=52441 RepID=A0A1I4AID7_9PROT|nr:carbonic anhydrase [Nitrosomonas aestuarii]SFK56235.1 carbonic anhydrase [Nitrosomonas aestuarii]
MLDTENHTSIIEQNNQQRRSFLKLTTASMLGLGLTPLGNVHATSSVINSPPLPENVLTPEAALERLMKGNERYVSGQSIPLNFSDERLDLMRGQNPYASVLSCSDSRVSPEFCFDEQRGDLFVARVAGNYLTTDFIATVEYAAAVLHTPLIMVLGHEKCGAVQAAIDATDNNKQFPGHIQSIATAITPAVRAVPRKPDYVAADRYYDIVKMNVILTVRELRKQPPILSRMVDSDKLKVVGGVYHLETGKVRLVA